MFNVMFIREPYRDYDGGGDTEGCLIIDLCSNVNEVEKLIKKRSYDQYHLERTQPQNDYGEWGFVVLEDSVIVSTYNTGNLNIDLDDCTDNQYSEDRHYNSNFDISKLVKSVNLHFSIRQDFINKLSRYENGINVKMEQVYKKLAQEKKERAQLAALLAKYPEMVNQNGTTK